MRILALGVLFALITGCSRTPEPTVTFRNEDPATLSAWGILTVGKEQLRLSDGVAPYGLVSTLFTDYAHKLRTVWLPQGMSAKVSENGDILFPVGTIISKTFYYPKTDKPGQFLKTVDNGQHLKVSGDGNPYLDLAEATLVETRLLVHRETGWAALPYVWNEAQTDATLEITGAVQKASLVSEQGSSDFPYIVPDKNQCGGCHIVNHSSRKLSPIGPKLRHLNRPAPGSDVNQIKQWQAAGRLISSTPEQQLENAITIVNWQDESLPLEARARSYLDINCGHCHSTTGAADTSGLYLDSATQDQVRLGRCKAPIAAGQGTGGNQFSIVPGEADKSILVYRMASLDPGAMMPELGRSLVHSEGISLIKDWINSMSGSCEPLGHTAAD